MGITIQPTGGLSNYLRVIFSYYQYTRENNIELNVIWKKTPYCPGDFLDYFEPIPHVTIKTNRFGAEKIRYKGCKPLKNYQPKYDKLKLKQYMEKIIIDKLDILNKNYISVHIRRTDHVRAAKGQNVFTTDEEFIDFLDKSDNNKNIYIATDNKNTYDKFSKIYKDRIKFKYHKVIPQHRQTSLQDAIIDIYMCVYSDDFKGSGYSSFSDLIKRVKKNYTTHDLKK
tara:strand:+ start:3170 stop:3847 length:678 start_codon:yes stop_codon:yes gene_type:complete